MTRRLGVLLLLLGVVLLPAISRGTGSLTIPNTLGALAGTQPASLLDANWTTIRDYVNNREISSGTLAARAAASIAGRWYFATDVNGGTLYFDTGATWTQVSPGVTGLALADQVTGCTLSNGAAGNTLGISICGAASEDATIANRIFMTATSAYTKTTAAWAVGTGNGALDSGSIAATTWYHVFLIQRVDTSVTDYLFSTNATAPTMPTNYTKQRRLGSFLTDSLNAINVFTQRGDSFLWATVPALNVNEVSEGTSALTATTTSPNGIVTEALLHACVSGGTAANALYVSALTEADTAPALTATPLGSVILSSVAGTTPNCAQTRVYTNTAREFRVRISSGGVNQGIYAVTIGWTDRRGRG